MERDTLVSHPQGGYFLAGEGGASSRWAKATPRGAIAGEGLEVIAKDEARAWAKHAGLWPDRFLRFGFEREEDEYLTVPTHSS